MHVPWLCLLWLLKCPEGLGCSSCSLTAGRSGFELTCLALSHNILFQFIWFVQIMDFYSFLLIPLYWRSPQIWMPLYSVRAYPVAESSLWIYLCLLSFPPLDLRGEGILTLWCLLQVFVASRLNVPGAWQMPQVGIMLFQHKPQQWSRDDFNCKDNHKPLGYLLLSFLSSSGKRLFSLTFFLQF